MNKLIKIIIVIVLISSVFVIGYFMPFWRQKPIPPPTPIEDLKPLPCSSKSYIKNGILYTSVKAIPLVYITKIELINDSIPFVIIHYQYPDSKYHL